MIAMKREVAVENDGFSADSEYIRDLYKYNFVFLQHGIIKDDLSPVS